MFLNRIFNLFSRKKRLYPLTCFGLSIGSDTLSVAIPDVTSADQTHYKSIHLSDMAIGDDLPETLAKLSAQHKLKGMPCYLVLSSAHYQVILMDKPKVSPEVYRTASLFQAKDLLHYPIEDCLAEVFLPSDSVPQHKNKIYLIVAQKSYVMPILDKLAELEIPAPVLTIEEFSIRNIIRQTTSVDLSAVLTFNGNEYLLTIIGQSDILFSRHISGEIGPELYRSLDFFFVALKKKITEPIYVNGVTSEQQQAAAAYCRENEYPVSFVELDESLQRFLPERTDLNLTQVLACGGVFRCQIDKVGDKTQEEQVEKPKQADKSPTFSKPAQPQAPKQPEVPKAPEKVAPLEKKLPPMQPKVPETQSKDEVKKEEKTENQSEVKKTSEAENLAVSENKSQEQTLNQLGSSKEKEQPAQKEVQSELEIPKEQELPVQDSVKNESEKPKEQEPPAKPEESEKKDQQDQKNKVNPDADV